MFVANGKVQISSNERSKCREQHSLCFGIPRSVQNHNGTAVWSFGVSSLLIPGFLEALPESIRPLLAGHYWQTIGFAGGGKGIWQPKEFEPSKDKEESQKPHLGILEQY